MRNFLPLIWEHLQTDITHAHEYIHTHLHTLSYTHTHTLAHIIIYTYTRAHALSDGHTHTNTLVHTFTHYHMYTYTYYHIIIHTHTNTHKHTCNHYYIIYTYTFTHTEFPHKVQTELRHYINQNYKGKIADYSKSGIFDSGREIALFHRNMTSVFKINGKLWNNQMFPTWKIQISSSS